MFLNLKIVSETKLIKKKAVKTVFGVGASDKKVSSPIGTVAELTGVLLKFFKIGSNYLLYEV